MGRIGQTTDTLAQMVGSVYDDTRCIDQSRKTIRGDYGLIFEEMKCLHTKATHADMKAIICCSNEQLILSPLHQMGGLPESVCAPKSITWFSNSRKRIFRALSWCIVMDRKPISCTAPLHRAITSWHFICKIKDGSILRKRD